jgi:hypothetical protein
MLVITPRLLPELRGKKNGRQRHPADGLRSCKSAVLLICHLLFLDGIYSTWLDGARQLFRRCRAPTKANLEALLHTISQRLARFLVKEGVLTQDLENTYLSLEHLQENPMQQVHLGLLCIQPSLCKFRIKYFPLQIFVRLVRKESAFLSP